MIKVARAISEAEYYSYLANRRLMFGVKANTITKTQKQPKTSKWTTGQKIAVFSSLKK